MKNEGFLFLEAAVLGFILVAMAGMFALPKHAIEIRRMNSDRMTAIHLAEEEFAVMELRAADGTLSDGTYGWLGPKEDLDGRPATYEIEGTVQKQEERIFQLVVRLRWQEGGAAQELRLERKVAHHDAP